MDKEVCGSREKFSAEEREQEEEWDSSWHMARQSSDK